MNFKCNYRKCRKELVKTAVVTSCSHIFCHDHNPSKSLNENNMKINHFVCAVCKSKLTGTFDFVEVDLQPPDPFKAMVLTGLRPETIIEIAARALGFWIYQMEQELQYSQYIIKKHTERSQNMENEFMKAYSTVNEEKSILLCEKENLARECDELREKLIAESRLVEKLTAEINQHSFYQQQQQQQSVSRHVSFPIAGTLTSADHHHSQLHQKQQQHQPSRVSSRTQQSNAGLMLGKNINCLMTKQPMFISPDSTLPSPSGASHARAATSEVANRVWGNTGSGGRIDKNTNLQQLSRGGVAGGRKYLSPLDNIINKHSNFHVNNKQNSLESNNSSQLSFGFN